MSSVQDKMDDVTVAVSGHFGGVDEDAPNTWPDACCDLDGFKLGVYGRIRKGCGL